MLRFAPSPRWYDGQGPVAPVHIAVLPNPDRYAVCCGAHPRTAEVILETDNPEEAAALAESLLASWPSDI
jgi:hypothetical protein